MKEGGYLLALKMCNMGACLMWSIGNLTSDKNGFIGIVSSYFGESELNLFKGYIKNNFIDDGGLVYVCSSDVKEKCLQFIDELEPDFKKIININRLSFISRDDYLNGNGIDMDGIIDKIEKEVNKLSEIDINRKTCVYISVDSFWNSVSINELISAYIRLRELYDMGKSNFLIRYIIEEVDKSHIVPIFKYHDYLVVDGIDHFDVYTPDELIHRGLTTLSERCSIEFKTNKAMMKSEYLENMREILGGIIHDINNLLVSILGHAQYCIEIDDREEIKKCLEIITRLALDGSSITKRLKGNFRNSIEAPKDIYKFDYIVKNCIDMIKHKFKTLIINETKNLDLNVSLNSKQYIYANEYDMRHSIFNIIQNGIDAMEDNGTMTIKTYDQEDKIVLEISDTGCGIDDKIINKVFNPYFTTKGSQGTGLGLSIAKKIIEEHGGEIYIESKLGNGTKFTIYFPAMKFSKAVAELNQEMYNTN